MPAMRVKLKKPKRDRKVQWTSTTIDNEHMNKKKSKCCCIYEKQRVFGESSSSSEDEDLECEHCLKHVEKKKQRTATVQEVLADVLEQTAAGVEAAAASRPPPPDPQEVDQDQDKEADE